jgi:hypothetical protein
VAFGPSAFAISTTALLIRTDDWSRGVTYDRPRVRWPACLVFSSAWPPSAANRSGSLPVHAKIEFPPLRFCVGFDPNKILMFGIHKLRMGNCKLSDRTMQGCWNDPAVHCG